MVVLVSELVDWVGEFGSVGSAGFTSVLFVVVVVSEGVDEGVADEAGAGVITVCGGVCWQAVRLSPKNAAPTMATNLKEYGFMI